MDERRGYPLPSPLLEATSYFSSIGHLILQFNKLIGCGSFAILVGAAAAAAGADKGKGVHCVILAMDFEMTQRCLE